MRTQTEFGIFATHKDEIWHICCAQRRNLAHLLRTDGIRHICCAQRRNLPYLLSTETEFGVSVAHKDGIWHICCAQRWNLAYLLRTDRILRICCAQTWNLAYLLSTKTEFRVSIVNNLSNTPILAISEPEILPLESLFITICKDCTMFHNFEPLRFTSAHAKPNAVFSYDIKRFLSLNSKPRPMRYHENMFIQCNYLRYVCHLTALLQNIKIVCRNGIQLLTKPHKPLNESH